MGEAVRDKRLKRSPAEIKALASDIIAGKPICKALEDNGYSPKVAKQGRAAIPQAVLAEIMAHGVKFAKVGKKLDPETVSDSIKGKLFTAMVTGQEKGINAAKMLGNMKDYNVFTADSQVGVIVIQPPAELSRELERRLGQPLPSLIEASTPDESQDSADVAAE